MNLFQGNPIYILCFVIVCPMLDDRVWFGFCLFGFLMQPKYLAQGGSLMSNFSIQECEQNRCEEG